MACCSVDAPTVKNIAVIGSDDCGKTYLIKAFIEMTDSLETARNYKDVALCNIHIDDTDFPLLIVEAPCSHNFRRKRSEIYEDADVVLVCFAVNDMTSFLSVTNVWFREIKQNRPDVPLVLVGNKCDLISQECPPNIIPYSSGLLTARNIKAFQYIECSANTKEGILDVIIAAVKATLK